jgi:hypothetical protein
VNGIKTNFFSSLVVDISNRKWLFADFFDYVQGNFVEQLEGVFQLLTINK